MTFHLSQAFQRRACADASAAAEQRGHRVLLLLSLSTLLASCWCSVRKTHMQRMGGRSPALPKRLETWENEGGRPLDDGAVAPDTLSPAVPASPSP